MLAFHPPGCRRVAPPFNPPAASCSSLRAVLFVCSGTHGQPPHIRGVRASRNAAGVLSRPQPPLGVCGVRPRRPQGPVGRRAGHGLRAVPPASIFLYLTSRRHHPCSVSRVAGSASGSPCTAGHGRCRLHAAVTGGYLLPFRSVFHTPLSPRLSGGYSCFQCPCFFPATPPGCAVPQSGCAPAAPRATRPAGRASRLFNVITAGWGRPNT